MSNPTNLHELADNLALNANTVQVHADSSVGAYAAGYRDALLDTRATVLSMISEAQQGWAEKPVDAGHYGTGGMFVCPVCAACVIERTDQGVPLGTENRVRHILFHAAA